MIRLPSVPALATTFAMLALTLPSPAVAQGAFPTRTVTIVVPFGAGGPTDLTARLVAEKLQPRWGQNVIVDNRPGAGGNVGSALVARAAPDGHTLVLGVTGSHGINVSLMSDMPYHPVRDFEPLTQATLFPNAIAVHPVVAARSLRDLLDYARRQPGKLTYGSDGIGTASHLGMELIRSQAGVRMVHVPFRGSAPMLQDLVGGQIDAGVTGLPTALPLARAGRLRLLAVTTAERVTAAPDLPTVADQGFPGYVAAPWAGFFAPRGTPPAIVAKLADDLIAALGQPDVRQRMADGGSTIVASRPETFRAFLAAEIDRWARAVKASGAKAE